MVFGKLKGSQAVFASLLCVVGLGCGTDDGNSGGGGYQQPPGSQVQSDAGAVVAAGGGVAGLTGGPGGVVTGGTAGGATPGGGATLGGGTTAGVGGLTGGGATGGITGGTGAPVGDLGANSQGDTFFRASTLVLKAPNVYGDLFGPIDVTAQAQDAVNALITTDANMDGFVDVSLLVRFLQTKTPAAANGQVTLGGGVCPLPIGADKPCGALQAFPFQSPAVAYATGQNCALQDTSEVAAGACFATSRTSLTISVPLLGPIPLQDGQVIGTWQQDGTITSGHVRGFLSKAIASTTKIPPGLPTEVQAVLPAGTAEMPLVIASVLSETQLGKDAQGQDGWWFLLEFTAQPATFNPALPAQ